MCRISERLCSVIRPHFAPISPNYARGVQSAGKLGGDAELARAHAGRSCSPTPFEADLNAHVFPGPSRAT